VDQQREQQRMRQSPVIRAHAVVVSASLEPVELKSASPSLLGYRCCRGAGWHHVPFACRPDRPAVHDLAKTPPGQS
jgi:hypothetical protein